MPSKTKAARLEQKANLEFTLNQHLANLAEKGLEPSKMAKDPTVKKLRAEIRKTTARLQVISTMEKKREGMIKRKTEKEATPKKEKLKKQKEVEDGSVSKRQQKKIEKKEKKQIQPDAGE